MFARPAKIGRETTLKMNRQQPDERDESEMTGRTFARLLRSAEAHYPISDSYERDYLPGKHWWTSQREHVTAWLDEIDGPGAYERASRGLGARHAYTHFQCAPGLLWIAEALGEDPAVGSAGRRCCGRSWPSSCAVRGDSPHHLVAANRNALSPGSLMQAANGAPQRSLSSLRRRARCA